MYCTGCAGRSVRFDPGVLGEGVEEGPAGREQVQIDGQVERIAPVWREGDEDALACGQIEREGVFVPGEVDIARR